MPKSADGQVNFNGGILSPRVDARVDNPKYKSGLRQCQNMIPYSQGPVVRRPGTQYIAKPKSLGATKAVRVLPFVFSPQTTFVIEVGHQYMRFYSNGAQVTVSGTPVEVATPYDATVTTTPWATDIFGLSFCQINDVVYFVHNSYPPYKLTRLSDTSWTFVQVGYDLPALLDENTSKTTLTPAATTGQAVTMTASAPSYAIGTFYALNDTVLFSGNIYVCLIPYTAVLGFSFDLAAGYWQLAPVFQSSHVGSVWQFRTLRNASSVSYSLVANGTSSTLPVLGNWRVETTEVWSADIAIQRSQDGGTTWVTLFSISGRGDTNRTETGSETTDCLLRVVVTNWTSVTSAIPPRVIISNEQAFIPGTFAIASVTSGTVATVNIIRPLNSTAASTYWSEAAWSGVRGYPRAIAAFQQRVIYASSTYEPQRIWGTVTNDLENFDRGNPPVDTNSFAFDLAAPGRGPILWMLAQQDLFCGFAGAEWVVNAGVTSNGTNAGGAITPTQVNAVEHSNWGSALGVQPHVMGTAVVYCQRQATNIRQMLFSVYTQKYMSQDVTENVDHLLAPGVVALDYQPQWRSQGNLWAITQQGALIGLSYDLDQEIFGWHIHQTGSPFSLQDGSINTPGDLGFESLCVIPGKSAADDELWLVCNRSIQGTPTRFIERMNPANWEQVFTRGSLALMPDPTQAFYVDCGLTVNTAGATATVSVAHLPGRYVVGLADGVPFGPIATGFGTITIPNYNSVTGYPQSVIVGLPIVYALQPMRIDLDPRVGSTQGMNKQLSDLFVRVLNSSGGKVSNGTLFANNASGGYQPPVPIDYTNKAIIPGANNFVQGPVDIRVQTQLNVVPGSDPVFIVQGQDAAPLTVVGLFYKYSLESTP